MFLFMVIHFHLFSVFYFIFLNSAAQPTIPGRRVRFQQSIRHKTGFHRFPTCFFEDSLGSFLAFMQNLLVLRILYLSFTVIAAPET